MKLKLIYQSAHINMGIMKKLINTNSLLICLTKYYNSDTMKIAIVSGKDEGPTKLNAFDNALSNAGIGDLILMKLYQTIVE